MNVEKNVIPILWKFFQLNSARKNERNFRNIRDKETYIRHRFHFLNNRPLQIVLILGKNDKFQ